ncbi:DUF4136 domain-containing protein [Pseudomaricurvus sp.]|uniref:DUF4136 domain-containing protein n=1 Tax=Pseudomaricurvus sp. TaxID=2004510 RepID=UPI003F6C1A36
MRKSLLTGFGVILASVLLYGCSTSGVSVDHDYKEGVNFSEYKTYRWRDISQDKDSYQGNDILKGRIHQAVDENLAAKGFQLVQTGDVDFTVNYSITTQAKTDVNSYNTYSGMAPGFSMGYGTGYYRYGYSMAYTSAPEVRTVHYEEGTFVLDVISDSDKLVWRGTAVGRLKKDQTVEEKRNAINNVVTKVLQEFPPETKEK